MSAQPCGCDPECNSHVCEYHQTQRSAEIHDVGEVYQPLATRVDNGPWVVNPKYALVADELEKGWQPLNTIHDSGKRVTYSSGSMRDPSEGKIKWSRITFGPMMRRWAQHLTTAEAKYPDVSLGVPNFTLIETEEELWRYKESAFRHFMDWFHDKTDEDHASACFFNINGVELIKDKWRRKESA